MDQATARRRLIGLRERREMTQAELSQALGFNDRQTLSYIELGKRNIAPRELVLAARFFGVSVDYFTDPFELAGEARFSWRECSNERDGLDAFEQRAGGWIATYRHLSRLRGDSVNSSAIRVALTAKSSFEEAAAEGDAVSRALELGDIPASTLADVLETTHDTLVLFVDSVPGVSGAACQLGALNTIIINRHEVEGRRSFDIGHELFHLLTWSEMPPPHIEGKTRTSAQAKRIEQLADNFAGALLMPVNSIRSYISNNPLPAGDALSAWLRNGATHFRVSGQALKYRLLSLGILRRPDVEWVHDHELRVSAPGQDHLPARFSRRFVDTLGWGIEEGHVSVRKAADVVGISIDDLADLFAEHGLKVPFDL